MSDLFEGAAPGFPSGEGDAPLFRNETVGCWQTDGPRGRALLWRVWLPGETAVRAWDVDPMNAGPLRERARELVARALEQQQAWSAEHPGALLPILQAQVQPCLLDPELLEITMVTGWALPLCRALPGGERRPEEAARLAREICRALEAARAAGFAPACLSPERVFLDEAGRPLLGPCWPGMDLAPQEGFSAPGSAEQQQGYSAAMLLFWLLNGGEGPFVAEAAHRQDAERRRLSGERLPSAGAGEGLDALLARLCAIPPARECSPGELERGLARLEAPAPDAEELARQEEERRARQEEEEERRAWEEEQLQRSRQRQERRAARDLGTDRGDRRLLGLLIGGAAVVIALVCLVVGMQAMTRLRASMEQGNYATALEQIEAGYQQGQNVDELVAAYVDQCLAESDQVRAMAAYQYLSGESAPDEEQLRRTVELALQAGQSRRVRNFLEELEGKGDGCALLARSLLQEYSEEIGS